MSITNEITKGFIRFTNSGRCGVWSPNLRGQAGVLLIHHPIADRFYICFGKDVHQLAISRASQIRLGTSRCTAMIAAYRTSPRLTLYVQPVADIATAGVLARELFTRFVGSDHLFNNSGQDAKTTSRRWGMRHAQPIIINGQPFDSINAAVKTLGLSQYEIQRRLHSNDPKWAKYTRVNAVPALPPKPTVQYITPSKEEAERLLREYMFATYPERKNETRNVPLPQAAA